MNMDLTKKEIEQNMMYLQNLPVVHDLLRKIDKLKRKNKELKIMVRLLTKEPIVKPVLERGQYIKREMQGEEQKTEENIKLIIDTSEEILDIESDDTDVVNPQSECSVVENKWTNIEEEEEEEGDNEVEATLTEGVNGRESPAEEEGANGGESPVEEEGANGGESPVEEVEVEATLTEGANGGESPVEEEGADGGESTVEEEGADGGESPAEDDDEEVMEIIIRGKTYYTTDDQNGVIYDLDEDGEISVEVGYFKNGKHHFNKK